MFFKQLKIDDSIEFVNMISSSLSSIITNLDKFEFIFKALDAKRRELLFPYVKDLLTALINNDADLDRVIPYVTYRQYKNLFHSCFCQPSPLRPRLC